MNYPYRECACGNQIHVGGRYLCDDCMKEKDEAVDKIMQTSDEDIMKGLSPKEIDQYRITQLVRLTIELIKNSDDKANDLWLKKYYVLDILRDVNKFLNQYPFDENVFIQKRIESEIKYGDWIIPECFMSELAKENFKKMIREIKGFSIVDVVARGDGKDIRYECDGLKYAYQFNNEDKQ